MGGILKTQQLRVNLYGGPGTGKSTAGHFLMFKLKEHGGVAEFAREVVKRRAFKGESVVQQRLVTEQVGEERDALKTGAPVVVCESPVYMQVAYCNNPRERSFAVTMAKILERDYPHAIHIFLARGERKFVQEGRFHNEAESVEMDQRILTILQTHLPPTKLHYVNTGEWEVLWNLVRSFS